MSEELDKTAKIRLSLDVTPAMKEIIEQLAAASGTTQADVLRQAVALLKTIQEAKAAGEMPALIDKEGHVTARLVGI